MRRTQAKLMTLSAVLVVVMTAATLGTLAIVTEGRQDYRNPAVGMRLNHLTGIVLFQDALLAAGLYALVWWTVFRPLKEVERYAASVSDAGVGARPLPPVPSFTRRARNPDLQSLRYSIDHMVRQLHTYVAALRKNEAMLSTILDSVPYLIWWKDPRGAYLGCNQAFADAAGGWKASEVVGKTDYDLSWPRKEIGAYLADDREVLTTNRPKRHIVEPITHGGTERRWSDTTKVPLRDADGATYGVLGVAEDITERKEAEEAVLREKAFNDAMLSGLPGVVCLYDEHGRLVRWNRRVAEVSGYSDEELKGRHVLEWVAPDQRDRMAAAVREAVRSGHAEFEGDIVVAGGRRMPYYSTGVRLTIEGKPYLLTIGLDIAERRRAEEALRHEKALTDAIFDNVPALLALYDDAGHLIRWNGKTNEITGYSDADLAAMVVGDRQPPEERERIIAGVHLAMWEGIQNSQEATLLTKGGGRVPFYFKGVRVLIGGRPHLLSIGVDISDRKRAEEDLRKALERAEEASRAKDRFLAAVSHELRTPLAPVLLLTSALEGDPRLPDDVHGDLGVVREHVEVEKRLIGDLLDFSAIHAGKLHIRPVPTDVHEVIRAAVRTCHEEIDRKGLRLDVRLDAQRHHALGDPDRLRQVFWNLLQNACKFTGDHCDISVRTTDDSDGHTLRVEVSDTGRGMDMDTLRRIFRPFEQGPRDERMQHYRGLGLGLAISKNLIEAHGGSISATSAGPGRGSTFIVRIPVTAPEASPPRVAPQAPAVGQAHLKLLLVEDHPLTLKTLARLLTAEGHEVTTAMSIAEALRRADGGRFDLVLSDIGLPDGSGLDLMPVLRERFNLSGIALSGFGADGDVEASRKAGFFSHLTKPVTVETLRDALQSFVASRATADTG